jgi:P-type Cu+ transporter
MTESEATMAEKDPVCGMMVEPEGAAATSEHEGKTYYFCSADCKEEFDSDPESYT